MAATLIFVAYSVWQNRSDKADSTIFVTTGELERLAALYTSEAGALPSETDMAAMVSDLVRDEALSREARRLGLDRDDTIITRRLAQKMSFVV
ncbi:MAG TPA: peptidyl-prolyl cis-trans isomerase, partial [Hyphomonas atlantica]|nr:peptidyl-prolyl cis-trans isomerase [Hyphomonas atlantica]